MEIEEDRFEGIIFPTGDEPWKACRNLDTQQKHALHLYCRDDPSLKLLCSIRSSFPTGGMF